MTISRAPAWTRVGHRADNDRAELLEARRDVVGDEIFVLDDKNAPTFEDVQNILP